jgi:hypothetical protein
MFVEGVMQAQPAPRRMVRADESVSVVCAVSCCNSRGSRWLPPRMVRGMVGELRMKIRLGVLRCLGCRKGIISGEYCAECCCAICFHEKKQMDKLVVKLKRVRRQEPRE